jgi:hypothetical protein
MLQCTIQWMSSLMTAPRRRSKRKVKHPCYDLILATMRGKSVPHFDKMR